MKILVAVKQVWDVELNIRVKDGAIAEDGLTQVMSKWDENAVEAAIQIKEAGDAEVVVASVGPEGAAETLRRCLAMGADRAILVNDPALAQPGSMEVAQVLAALAQKENADLVITGLQAQDSDMGAAGPMAAEFLGWPSVVNVIKASPPAGGKMAVERRGEEGTEQIELTLPALITANDSLNEPRLASLKGIMMAKKKPLDSLDLAALGLSSLAAALKPQGYAPPAARAAGKKLEGEPEDLAAQLVALLVNEAKVLG